MATIKVYEESCRLIKKLGMKSLKKGKLVDKNLDDELYLLFGKKELVSEKEFMRCSESEKRRHLCQDYYLRSSYIELESKLNSSVNITKKLIP